MVPVQVYDGRTGCARTVNRMCIRMELRPNDLRVGITCVGITYHDPCVLSVCVKYIACPGPGKAYSTGTVYDLTRCARPRMVCGRRAGQPRERGVRFTSRRQTSSGPTMDQYWPTRICTRAYLRVATDGRAAVGRTSTLGNLQLVSCTVLR